MSVQLVGRVRETSAIQQFLIAPWPRQLAIAGEAGIGKTTMLAALTELARERGDVVLAAGATERGARVPLAGLLEMFERVVDEPMLSGVAPPRAGALLAALGLAPAPAGVDLGLTAAGLAEVLERLSSSQPVLLVVDDLQWLDPDSRTVLELALRRCSGLPVGVAATVRVDGSHGAEAIGLGRIPTDVLMLSRLPDASLARIVRSASGRVLPRGVVVAITEASDGNPLLAIELARQARSDGNLFIPERYENLVITRLTSLTPPVRDVVDLVVLADRPEPDLLERLVGHEPVDRALQSGLVRLRAGRLISDHPLTDAVVSSQLTASRRRRLHRAVAEVHPDPEARTIHLGLACDGPDETVAVAHERLAEAAAARGARLAAADLARRAATLSESGAGRARRLVASARYSTAAGALGQARELLEEATTDVDSDECDRLLALVEVWMALDDRGRAASCAESALERAVDELDVGRCHAAIAASSTKGSRHESEHARAALRIIGSRLDRLPDVACQALVIDLEARLALGEGVDWRQVDLALRLEAGAVELRTMDRPSLALSAVFNTADRPEEARRLLDASRAAAELRGDHTAVRLALAHSVVVDIMSGAFASARSALTEIRALDESLDDELWAASSYEVWLDALTGRCDAAAVRGRLSVEPESWQAIHRGRASGVALLVERRWSAAASELAAAHRGALQHDVVEPAYFRVLADLIEAEALSGDLVAAHDHLDELVDAAARSGLPWNTMAGDRGAVWIARAEGRRHVALERAECAVVSAGRSPSRFELGRTLLAAGLAARDAGRRRQARSWLSQAGVEFDAVGAGGWSRRVREELAMVSGRRSDGINLSDAERRIAGLAAAGLRNREIAEQLFITERTVESHLSATYRKLGIRSRSQLSAALGER